MESFPTAILGCVCLKIKAGLDFNVPPPAVIMAARGLILLRALASCKIAVS